MVYNVTHPVAKAWWHIGVGPWSPIAPGTEGVSMACARRPAVVAHVRGDLPPCGSLPQRDAGRVVGPISSETRLSTPGIIWLERLGKGDAQWVLCRLRHVHRVSLRCHDLSFLHCRILQTVMLMIAERPMREAHDIHSGARIRCSRHHSSSQVGHDAGLAAGGRNGKAVFVSSSPRVDSDPEMPCECLLTCRDFRLAAAWCTVSNCAKPMMSGLPFLSFLSTTLISCIELNQLVSYFMQRNAIVILIIKC